MRTLQSAIVGLFILTFVHTNLAQATALSKPPHFSVEVMGSGEGYQHIACTFPKKGGGAYQYTLQLFYRAQPDKGLFEGVEIHRLDGMQYLLARFTSRRTVEGYVHKEQKSFEAYTRTEQKFFVHVDHPNKEHKWEEYQFSGDVQNARERISSLVDRDFLFVHGTSTNAIKECLRTQSRSQSK